jgi:hypothetical protein
LVSSFFPKVANAEILIPTGIGDIRGLLAFLFPADFLSLWLGKPAYTYSGHYTISSPKASRDRPISGMTGRGFWSGWNRCP